MTKEDKELLLKDLCARLPYGVCVHVKGEYRNPHKVDGIDVEDGVISYFEHLHLHEELITVCYPYLRPMSSMTEEEETEYHVLCYDEWCAGGWDYHDTISSIDWLNAHHFDYRGLIEKGLAIEALDGMYK